VVFTQDKALGCGLSRNWAHTQLHLIRALMPVKPAPKGLTLHLTWIIFPSSSALKEENYMEKVGYTHCTQDFLMKTPRRGGRQQPHQTLKKSKKYKGGKKHPTMVMQSTPKMPKWHHFTLKA
jgi:hypothetical protein